MVSREVRRWRKAVRARGIELVEWMRLQSGAVTLCDDDAAAIAEYVRWLDAQEFSVWNMLSIGE